MGQGADDPVGKFRHPYWSDCCSIDGHGQPCNPNHRFDIYLRSNECDRRANFHANGNPGAGGMENHAGRAGGV